MIEYGDEEIIQRRVAARARKKYLIYNEVEIDGVLYAFERREFAYGFSMVVPESFDVLAVEYAKRKYPYEDRPKIIISSENTETCLAFNCGGLGSETVEERIQIYRSCIKRLHPSNVFFSDCVYEISDRLKVACYDYRYTVLDGDAYSLSFFADLPDRELLGCFTCPVELQSKWEPLAREMIRTIQILEVDGGNGYGEN